jgi:hypothetical protein
MLVANLRSSAGHLAEETATAARCGRSLLRSGRRSVLVGRRSGSGAGLASLGGLLGRRARLRSRDGGALGRRGGTAGLARHDCWFMRLCWYLGRCWRFGSEMRLVGEAEVMQSDVFDDGHGEAQGKEAARTLGS